MTTGKQYEKANWGRNMNDALRAIETKYDGHRFRSRAEARWAVFFNAAGLRYEYEKEGFDLGGTWYLPDFWLPEIGFWLEVKGDEPNDGEKSLCQRLADASDKPVLLAIGAPEPRNQLVIFQPSHKEDWTDDARFYFADDRRNEREFWLVSDGFGGMSIGPDKGPNHFKDPGLYGAAARGYKAVREARFEHGEIPHQQ